MPGAEAAGVLILLTLALIASAIIVLLLVVVIVVLLVKRRRRAARYCAIPILLLVIAWGGVYLYFKPAKKRKYDVRFTANPPRDFLVCRADVSRKYFPA